MNKESWTDLDIRDFRKLLINVINFEDGIEKMKIYQALFWFILSHGYHFWFVALLEQQEKEWAGDPLTKEQKLTLIDEFNSLEKEMIISNGLLSVYEETLDKISDIQGSIQNPFLKKIMPKVNRGISIASWILIAGCIIVRPTILPLVLAVWSIVGMGFEGLSFLILRMLEQQLKQVNTINQSDLIIKNVNQKVIKDNTSKYVKLLVSLGLVDKKFFRLNWFEINHDPFWD